MNLVTDFPLYFGVVIAGFLVVMTIYHLLAATSRWWRQIRQVRIARIEAELDAKEAELRRTILDLANQLATEKNEASRALTRAAFLTSAKRDPSR